MSEVERFLAELNDPRRYERLPDRIIFDEHEEPYRAVQRGPDGKPVHGPDGKPKMVRKVRVFDRKRLERIAARCNARVKTGNLSTLNLGHTIDDEDGKPSVREEDQPEPVGWAANYRVRWDNKLGRYVIAADYYLRRDKADRAKTFPRTSVELWPVDPHKADAPERGEFNGDFFDPIALIRRTPERDLGTWVQYRRRNGLRVIRYSKDFHMDPEQNPEGMAAAAQEPTAEEMPPEKMAMHYARHCMAHPYARKLAEHFAMEDAQPEPGAEAPVGPPGGGEPDRYEAGPGFPGATSSKPPGVPDMTDEEKKVKYRRDADAIKYARFEKRIADLEADADAARKAQAEAEAQQCVNQLIGEGYDLDAGEEVPIYAALDRKGRAERMTYTRKRVRQAPVERYARLPVSRDDTLTPGPKPVSREERDRAISLATRKGVEFDEALAEIRGGNGTAR